MRCVDVIRQLSAPTGSSEHAAVAAHLAECAECAAWAERDARLGRLLELTRPQDLSTEEWDCAWGRICDTLDGTPAVVLPMKRPARSRRVLWVALGVAQVAAVLLAMVYFSGVTPRPGMQVADKSQPAKPGTLPAPSVHEQEPVDIPSGELVVLREEKGRVEMIELALNGNLGQVDPAYEALNSLEAIAE